jgi:hypothetical protein
MKVLEVLDAGKTSDRNHDYWSARTTATEILTVADIDLRTLDYWVAVVEGIRHPKHLREMAPGFVMVPEESYDEDGPVTVQMAYNPSQNAKYSADIIEEEKIGLDTWQGNWGANYGRAVESPDEDHNPGHHRQRGATFLEAAMRCYLAKSVGAVFYAFPDGKNLPFIESVERKRRKKVKDEADS